MIPSWLDPWPDFADIWAEVWREERLALPWPRKITSRWTTSPRGKSLPLPLPLPRSWLGVGGPTPLSPPAHTH